MRFFLPPCGSPIGLVLSLLLAITSPAPAQTTSPAPATTPATDVILRLDGEEVAGRVLLITPTELRYLPAPVAGAPVAAAPDTLQLPVAAVFLVRYANGTREVLTRPPVAAPLLGDGRLDTLSGAERQRLGRTDALRYYKGRGVFWGSAGAAFYLGPLFGLGSTGLLAGTHVAPRNLAAPVPALLQDPDYRVGYRQQAHRVKRGKAWAGYGAGTIALLGVLFVAIVADLQ